MNKKASDLLGNLTSKAGAVRNVSLQKTRELADRAKRSIEKLSDEENIKKIRVSASEAAAASVLYLRESPQLLKTFSDNAITSATQLTSKENVEKYKAMLSKATEDTWAYVRESPEVAREKFRTMDKSHKVLALSAMAGGAVVSIPFILALGPMSIVSALTALGLGALSAGGYGVAGGIIVTAGGAVLATALAGTVANKLIDDPEISELIDSYGKLEEIIKQNFQVMESDQERFRGLYEKYAKIAEFVAELRAAIENGEDYDLKQVRERNTRIQCIIEDISSRLASEKE